MQKGGESVLQRREMDRIATFGIGLVVPHIIPKGFFPVIIFSVLKM